MLAQLYVDGALIVSIDESSFRCDVPAGRRWQFHPKVRDIYLHLDRAREPTRERTGPLEEHQSYTASWGDISEQLS